MMLVSICRKTKGRQVECTLPDGRVVTFDRDNSAKPDYRSKWVMINCYRYAIMWDKRGER